MAIYYGTRKIKIIEDLEGDDVRIQHENIIEEVPVNALEADGGIEEIHEAVRVLKIKKDMD
jgi:hypothetical protein